jgi:hypothetical protein
METALRELQARTGTKEERELRTLALVADEV